MRYWTGGAQGDQKAGVPWKRRAEGLCGQPIKQQAICAGQLKLNFVNLLPQYLVSKYRSI